jgi:hypothetical protein
MAGLSPTAAHFFKFLLILVLYSLAMTLYVIVFLLGTFFQAAHSNFRISCSARSSKMAVSPYFSLHFQRYIK